MKAYRCKECGTGYSTTGDVAPPSPNWDDGHKCVMVEVESYIQSGNPDFNLSERNIELEREARMRIIGQNGNTGEHYDK